MIILMHNDIHRSGSKSDSGSSCPKKLSLDAVNSITIKLM